MTVMIAITLWMYLMPQKYSLKNDQNGMFYVMESLPQIWFLSLYMVLIVFLTFSSHLTIFYTIICTEYTILHM